MKKNVKKITVGGLLIALALVLPMAFHLTGVPQPGQVFLPMHIPVLLGGFVLGPVFGFFVGLFSPIISSVLTGMPAVGRLPFMMIELAVYGLVSGLMYNTFKFNKKKMGIYFTFNCNALRKNCVCNFIVCCGKSYGYTVRRTYCGSYRNSQRCTWNYNSSFDNSACCICT